MALFKVNTGCREQEVCGLRLDWEIDVPELDTSVFLVPAERVKNGEERLVVLNSVARSVVESQRGLHPEYVFTYDGRRQQKMNNSAWRKARKGAGFPQVRVHDLRHYSEFRIIPSNLPEILTAPLLSGTCTLLAA